MLDAHLRSLKSRAPSQETVLTLTLSRKLAVSPFSTEMGSIRLTLTTLIERSKGSEGVFIWKRACSEANDSFL